MAARTAVAIPQKACGKRSCPTGGYTIRPYRHGAIMAVHPVGARIARPRRVAFSENLTEIATAYDTSPAKLDGEFYAPRR